MKIIVFGFIVWLMYDTYKDRKIEKELQKIKQSFTGRPTKKGGADNDEK